MFGIRAVTVAALMTAAPGLAQPATAEGAATVASRTVDLKVASEPGVVLAGTLHLPAGVSGSPPIAVLLQGHGRNGRHGFDEIIKRLLADGTGAFAFDKRGVEQSTGTHTEDLARLTADGQAVVRALRRRSDVDGRRILLIGHSQGGTIAPAIAAADPQIAGIVLLAGSIGDGLPYLSRAIRDQLLGRGMPVPAADAIVAAATALLQARIERRDAVTITPLRNALVARFEAAGLPRSQAEGALATIDVPEAWNIDKLRSASDLAAVRAPVLAVFGEKDPMVIAGSEAPAARTALANNPRAQVVVLEGLSHWFQEGAVTGGEEEFAKLGPNAGSPRLVKLVGDWVRDVVHRP